MTNLSVGKLHEDTSGRTFVLLEAILERHGATLDKFIGDCVLGYWLGTSLANRLGALKAAHAMRRACEDVQNDHLGVLEPLGLRFGSGAAVHVGPAAYGAFSSREFTLLGDAVNLDFRLESLTGTLGQHVLVSADLLAGFLPESWIAPVDGPRPAVGSACPRAGSFCSRPRCRLVESA